MNLYIDIETIPSQLPWVKEDIRLNIKAPGNYKKPEAIAKWKEDNWEDQWLKTSLDGSRGEIICIAWALDDSEPEVVWRKLPSSKDDYSGSEEEVIRSFFSKVVEQIRLADLAEKGLREAGELGVPGPVWVGHYLTGFDLRFIWQRCVINSIPPQISIPYDATAWDRRVFDTKLEWSGKQPSGAGSLDMVSRLLGYEGKGDIDGSKVWGYVQDGREEEVAEYCRQDVEKTRILHKRMTFL